MPLTEQQKKDYVEKGYAHCPVCKSGDISGGPVEVDCETAWQEVVCSNCNAVWHDIYTLSNVELQEEGK